MRGPTSKGKGEGGKGRERRQGEGGEGKGKRGKGRGEEGKGRRGKGFAPQADRLDPPLSSTIPKISLKHVCNTLTTSYETG